MRLEITDHPHWPKRDIHGTSGDSPSGQFFSEFVTLSPGRFAARVQLIFSEKAADEKLTISVQSGSGRMLLA